MQYEIDFMSIDSVPKNADAIAMRWRENENNPFTVGIYDGGYQKHGEQLCKHIKKYYDTEFVDFIVCSHPDADHAIGLATVLENLTVGCLYMNIPWLYINDIYDKVDDGRITEKSLKDRLKRKYPYIAQLEDIADKKGITILPCFEGDVIENDWKVLSPSKEFYLNQLIQSEKTPLEQKESLTQESFFSKLAEKASEWIKDIWNKDSLLKNPETSAENEMSTVLLGDLGENNKVLLTADAGLRALNAAYEYALSLNVNISQVVDFFQIPHHGGRHNLDTDIMNKMVGPILERGKKSGRVAYVSTAKTDEYPKRAVVNAFIRRGVDVFSTNGCTLWYHKGTPARGWKKAVPLNFFNQVENPDS